MEPAEWSSEPRDEEIWPLGKSVLGSFNMFTLGHSGSRGQTAVNTSSSARSTYHGNETRLPSFGHKVLTEESQDVRVRICVSLKQHGGGGVPFLQVKVDCRVSSPRGVGGVVTLELPDPEGLPYHMPRDP